MKKQELIDLGIADDVADKIFALHGRDIEKHKEAAEASKAEVENFKTQLIEANNQIEGFKGLDIEGVKKAADDWKAKAEQAEADAAVNIQKLKFDHALESSLTGAKAKSIKAVRALLNAEALKLNDDGTIEGLDDQLKTIRTENDYLFASDKPAPKIVTKSNNKPVTTDAMTNEARKAAGLPVAES